MKTNKSTGPKSIPTHILKTSNQIICKPPTYLINLSFPNKFFPDLIKTSNVIPAFKKGENQDYNNYRLISLTSNLSKLKNCTPKTLQLPQVNSLLFERQYGFCNKLFQPFQCDLGDISREILPNMSLLLKNFRKLEEKSYCPLNTLK